MAVKTGQPPVVPRARDLMTGALSDDQTSPATRALWVVAMGLLGTGAMMPVVGLAFVVAAMEKKTISKFREKNAVLTSFVADKCGKLDAVEMQAGVWYAYVAPKELARTEDNLSTGGCTFLLVAALLVPVGLLWLKVPQGKSTALLLGCLVVPLLATGVWSLERRLRLKKRSEGADLEGRMPVSRPQTG